MVYVEIADKLLEIDGVHLSTVMKYPCLRYKGKFFTMMFMKNTSLLVKLPAERVNELIHSGIGREFNVTGKRFREWVLIPIEYEENYESLMKEALQFAMRPKS